MLPVGHLLSNLRDPITNNQPLELPVPGTAEPEYKCPVCKDFGVVYPRKTDGTIDYANYVDCQCVKAERLLRRKQALIRWCELPVKTETFTFENFKVSPDLTEAYDAAIEVADGKFEKTFLTFMGPSDNGKTHLLVAICRRWLAYGKPARYAYVPLLLHELKSGFSQGADSEYEERWQRFLNIDLLALDDLGTENPTSWVQEHLDTLIDYRLMHKLPTVVTTNLLLEQLTFRIHSRLQRDGLVIGMDARAYCEVRRSVQK